MKNDYSRSVSMQCSTCGGMAFEFDNEEGPIRCTGCDRVYATKDELIAENGGRIDGQVDEIGKELLKDVQKDLSKMFKKFR